MSRAGEKLYGEGARWNDAYERERPQRRRVLLRDLALLAVVLAVGSAALFGWG